MSLASTCVETTNGGTQLILKPKVIIELLKKQIHSTVIETVIVTPTTLVTFLQDCPQRGVLLTLFYSAKHNSLRWTNAPLIPTMNLRIIMAVGSKWKFLLVVNKAFQSLHYHYGDKKILKVHLTCFLISTAVKTRYK